MRIALCFSGQPRFVSECFDKIRANVIDFNSEHQIDVFVHTWFSEDICNKKLYVNEFSSFSGDATIPIDCIDRINNLYNPKSILVDAPINFKPTKDIYENFIKFAITGKSDFGMPVEEFQFKKTEGLYSMMYSFMKSIAQKKIYELQFGFKYDLVLKMRFDNIVNSPIDFQSFDNNTFYSQENGNKSFELCDWLNVGSSEIMDTFGSIFFRLETLINYSVNNFGGWSVESILKSCCLVNDIKHTSVNIRTSLPVWGIIK